MRIFLKITFLVFFLFSSFVNLNGQIPPSASISGTSSICLGQSAILSITFTGGGTNWDFVYSDGTNSYIINTTLNPYLLTVTPLTNATYTLLSVSSGGVGGTISGAEATISVHQSTPPTATLTGNCSGPPNSAVLLISLTGTPPWNFQLFDGSSYLPFNNITTSPSGVVINSDRKIYTIVNVSDANCSGSFTGSVMALPPLAINPSGNVPGNCSITLNTSSTSPSEYSNISWLKSSVAVGSGTSYTADVSGAYQATSTAYGCISKSQTATVSISNSIPTPTISPAPPFGSSLTVCPSGSLNLTATPGYVLYKWMKDGVVVYSGNNNFLNVSASGDYTVKVYDNAGNCSAVSIVDRVIVQNTPAPEIISFTGTKVCNNTTTLLASTFSAFYQSYLWSTNQSTSSILVSAPGTYTLTVTDFGGCQASKSIVMNQVTPTSAPVISASGPVTFCQGSSVTLSSTSLGPNLMYRWMKDGQIYASNTSNVPITVTSSGNYSLLVYDYPMLIAGWEPANCYAASNTIAVNVLPNPVLTVSPLNPSICSGSSVAMNVSGANTYSWYPTSGLNTASGSQVVANPTVNITYTITGTGSNGCISSRTTNVTVNPIPDVTAISHYAGPACPGASVYLEASGAFSYSWTPSPDLPPPPIVSQIIMAKPTATTTYTVLGTNLNGCSKSASVTVFMNTRPAIVVSPSNPSICSGGSVTLTASGGSAYYWYSDPAYTQLISTNPNITVSPTQNASYYLGVVDNNSCGNSTSTLVTVIPNLPVSVSIGASPSSNICSGTNVTFTATPVNGGAAPAYQWRLNGTNISGAVNSTYSTSSLVSNDVITCMVNSNYPCPIGNPAISNGITMTVNPNLPVSVIVTPTANTICSGINVTFTAAPTNGGSTPMYQWKVGGVDVGTNSSTYSSSTLTNGQAVTCILTSNAVCPTGSPATSNVTTMGVNPNLPVSVIVTPTANTICSGTNVTFTAAPTNGGSAPIYQWKVSGVDVGTNSSTYSSSTLTNGQTISCVLTSNAVCPTGSPATSNVTTMGVNPNLPVSVIVTPSATTICSGTNVTFTAAPTNGGSAPIYQWKVSGVNVGTNSSTYSSSTLTNGQTVTCVLTSNAVCPTGSPATSNVTTIGVNPNLPVSVSIGASPSNNICSGTNVTFTATPTNGGTIPVYQWNVNGISVGTSSPTYSSSTLTNGQIVTCVLTSNAVCPTGNPAISNGITMAVNPNLPVSVNIAPSSNNICSGTSVMFTATPSNGGSAPFYQWKVNGSNVGTNSPTYSSSTFANNQVVTCVLTSNAICPTGNPATSNAVTMIVNSNPVSLSISPSVNNICPGTGVTFTATPTNGGSVPGYQWKVGTLNVGTNSPTYTSSTLTNNQVVTCVLTSNVLCPIGNPATSNGVTMIVNPYSITTGTISPTSMNVGAAVNIPYSVCGVFNAGNGFTAQLSDASGSFGNPVNIGSATSGTIAGTIPCTMSGGTGYRIRVISSNPAVIGTTNVTNITIVEGQWHNDSVQITIPVTNADMVTANQKLFFKGANDNKLYVSTPNYTGANYAGYWTTTPLLSTAPSNVAGNISLDNGGPNNVKIFYRGTDNFLHSYSWNGSTWTYSFVQNWYALTDGDIGTENNGSGAVFFRGTDNKLYFSQTSGAVTLIPNPVANVGGDIKVDPIRGRVFYRGLNDNFLYYYYWNGPIGAWSYAQVHNWFNLGVGDIGMDYGSGAVYYRCTDNQLRMSGTSGAITLIPNSIANVAGDVTVDESDPNSVKVFYRGIDNFLYYYYWNGPIGAWSYATVQNTIPLSSGDIIVNQGRLFYRSTTNKIYMSARNAAGTWITGTLTTTAPANTLGNIVADNTNPGHVRIFYTTTTNGVSDYFYENICTYTTSSVRMADDINNTLSNTEIKNSVNLYPNPTNGSITIEYMLVEKSNLKLSVFNSLGILVKEIAYGESEAGSISLQADLSSLPEGIYQCHLTGDNQLFGRTKLLVLK